MPLLAPFPSVRLSKPTCRVDGAIELDALAAKLSSKPHLGARIEDLHIVLDTPFPVNALRESLKHMPNLTGFTLLTTELDIPALFHGVHLPKIQFFHTNVSHQLLTGFLAMHTTISVLKLAGCGGGELPCPLNGMDFDHVRCISGPANCVSCLTHNDLIRLTSELSDGPQSPSRLLRTIPDRLGSLYALTIDFYADEYDILDSIAAACQTVQKLKLLEKPPAVAHRKTSRRIWNDGLAWFNALRRLPSLEQLLLRTTSPVLRGSRIEASEADERKTFMCWVNGVYSAHRRRHPKPHPVLYHIGVWYRAGTPGRGVVTHWSQASGSWRRIALVENPPADYDFV